jgi:hypothetical protein
VICVGWVERSEPHQNRMVGLVALDPPYADRLNSGLQAILPMNHCIAKIVALVEQGRDDRRSVLQIGYNLGRLSELTGLGREPFWDAWKDAVADWDLPRLRELARDLPSFTITPINPKEIPAGSTNPATEGE